MALAVASVSEDRRESESPLARAVSRHAGLCWLGAAVAFAGLTALLHPGGVFGIVRALATTQPIAKTLGAIALGIALNALLLLPAIFGEREGGLPRRVLAWAPLAWIGLISYGVYLWHLTIAQLLGLHADPHFSATGVDLVARVQHLTTLILFVVTLGATVAVAAGSYYLVELPFLRRKER
jgi:peptidoglycan/LPS O-acetylase OafA/YrhL